MLKYCLYIALLKCLVFALPMPQHPFDDDDLLHPQHEVPSDIGNPVVIKILESASTKSDDGSYHFHFQAEDGSFREETAVMRNVGTKQAFLEVTGSYSYFDANGKEVLVNYTANKGGFVASGNNISPAVAEAAKRNSELPPQRTHVDEERTENKEMLLNDHTTN